MFPSNDSQSTDLQTSKHFTSSDSMRHLDFINRRVVMVSLLVLYFKILD